MFNKKLFRDKALERLSSPEEFDIPIKIINIRSWIFLLSMLAATASIVLWFGFSKINQEANCSGLIVKDNCLTDVLAVRTGFIDNIRVNASDSVNKGDILLNLISAEDKEKLNELENKSIFESGGNFKNQLQGSGELPKEYKLRSAVLSPVEGSLFELKVSKGNFVKTGDKLLTIEQKDTSKLQNSFTITGFVSIGIINSVKEGAEVLISPMNIDVKEYGYLLGNVKRIAGYPVSQERKRMLEKENPSIAKNLSSEIFEVTIVPKMINNQLIWTGNKTPAIKFINGTACNLKVIISSKNLLSYVF